MEIKTEFSTLIISTSHFDAMCKMLRDGIGSTPTNWRLRKTLADGTKNVGQRCRIKKQLRKGVAVQVIVEVFIDVHDVTKEDFLALRLVH